MPVRHVKYIIRPVSLWLIVSGRPSHGDEQITPMAVPLKELTLVTVVVFVRNGFLPFLQQSLYRLAIRLGQTILIRKALMCPLT